MDNEPVSSSELSPEGRRELLARVHELDEHRKLEALDRAHRAAHVPSFLGGIVTLIAIVYVDGGLPLISGGLSIGIWVALGFLATLGTARLTFSLAHSDLVRWEDYPFSPPLPISAFLYFLGGAVASLVATQLDDFFWIIMLLGFGFCVIGIGSLIARAVAFYASRGTKDSEAS